MAETVEANPGMDSIELDIANPAGIRRVSAELISRYPKLNVLINNAGIMQVDDVAGDVDDKLVASTIATNLMGPIRLTGTLIEHLEKQESAAVLKCLLCPRLYPDGDSGGVLLDQGGSSLLFAVSAFRASQHAGPRPPGDSSVGAHGTPQ